MDSVERILWTERGIDSLETLIEHIAIDSSYYASRFAQSILQKIESLRDFPRMGRIVPELQKPFIRELIYQNYRIVYQLDRQTIYILLICHGMQILPDFLDVD